MDYTKTALEILTRVCETDEVEEDLDLDLLEAGFIDSLSAISLILEIEDLLGVKLQITDLEKDDFNTVNHFAAFLERKAGEA